MLPNNLSALPAPIVEQWNVLVVVVGSIFNDSRPGNSANRKFDAIPRRATAAAPFVCVSGQCNHESAGGTAEAAAATSTPRGVVDSEIAYSFSHTPIPISSSACDPSCDVWWASANKKGITRVY